ncbi:hypothetical protein [Hymenobacter terrenus]|uniref:hypothetical protein n=1 Tax=Hymenobacter terrenus TaxID=1629124 RepID=UPI000619998C|nr:hypothetical protein [Hymenobacter terrenus]
MTDDIEDILEDISTLLAKSAPTNAWQSIVLECNTVGDRNMLSAKFYEAHSTIPQPFHINNEDKPYEQTLAYLFAQLRILTAEQAPFQSPWYTALITVDKDGAYQFQCDYDYPPALNPAPSEEEYVRDFQQFSRTEASTPEWLRTIVERHQLPYYEPESLTESHQEPE